MKSIKYEANNTILDFLRCFYRQKTSDYKREMSTESHKHLALIGTRIIIDDDNKWDVITKNEAIISRSFANF